MIMIEDEVIAMTLTMRKMCVRPRGTVDVLAWRFEDGRTESWRTVSVVVEIEQLVAPLCYYSEGVFEKCYDDEETADGWEESTVRV
jgi:hypothetical protein